MSNSNQKTYPTLDGFDTIIFKEFFSKMWRFKENKIGYP